MKKDNNTTVLYLSAPMRGLSAEKIRENFDNYQRQVAETMHRLDIPCKIINPAKLCGVYGTSDKVFDARDYLVNDLYLLSKADGLVLCEQDCLVASRGCAAECAFAVACQIPVYFLKEVEIGGKQVPILEECDIWNY